MPPATDEPNPAVPGGVGGVPAGTSVGHPRVGITFSLERDRAYYDTYARALAEAGADPVLIAARPDGVPDAGSVLEGLDALLLPGGWDVDPAEYGEEPGEVLTSTDPALDRTEVDLIRGAVSRGLPVLGICRGMQVVNVAMGGTLAQHVEGHDVREHGRDHLAHEIVVAPDSELARVAGGGKLLVNSLHHQAIGKLGAGLRPTAWSPDGVVEALESERIVAVQCHPEELVRRDAWPRLLLERFVDRARPEEVSR